MKLYKKLSYRTEAVQWSVSLKILLILHSSLLKVILNHTVEYGVCVCVYVVLFYSTVSEIFNNRIMNGVPLKSGLGVTQGHWKLHHRPFDKSY